MTPSLEVPHSLGRVSTRGVPTTSSSPNTCAARHLPLSPSTLITSPYPRSLGFLSRFRVVGVHRYEIKVVENHLLVNPLSLEWPGTDFRFTSADRRTSLRRPTALSQTQGRGTFRQPTGDTVDGGASRAWKTSKVPAHVQEVTHKRDVNRGAGGVGTGHREIRLESDRSSESNRPKDRKTFLLN